MAIDHAHGAAERVKSFICAIHRDASVSVRHFKFSSVWGAMKDGDGADVSNRVVCTLYDDGTIALVRTSANAELFDWLTTASKRIGADGAWLDMFTRAAASYYKDQKIRTAVVVAKEGSE